MNTSKKTIWIISCLLLLSVGNLSAQDFKSDLEAVAKAYGEMKTFNIEVQVSTFRNADDQNPMERNTAKVKKSDTGYYYETTELVMLNTESYNILVEKESKRMTYSKPQKKQGPMDLGEIPVEMDTDELQAQLEAVTFLGIEAGSKRYRITDPANSGAEVELFINTKTMIPDKMIYRFPEDYPSDDKKMVISYPIFDTSPQFSKSTFSSANFVKEDDNGKFSPVEKYKSYELIVNK